VSATDLASLAPLMIVGATAIVAMLATAFRRDHGLTATITILGLVVAACSLAIPATLASRQVTSLLIMDRFTIFFSMLILSATVAAVMLTHGYLERCSVRREEMYVLMLLAAFGSMVLVASTHLVSFFLGLEILSVSLYTLIAYHRGSARSAEAGVKYLVLGALSSAFLVFGMALVYFETGTVEFSSVASMSMAGAASSPVVLGGISLILVSVGFKLSLVPFHMWVADVFEGASAPVTAFVATVSKGSVFALILRYFAILDVHAAHRLFLAFALIATSSMFVGNGLALMQKNIKRMLAYSSIAHMGYLLVAFLASGSLAPVAVTYYLVAYFITTLAAFGAVSVLSSGTNEPVSMDRFLGLAWRRPWLAAGLTASLLSLAGIPLTAGFFGKFFVVWAGLESRLWTLVVILVVNSAIGLFYYLRVVTLIYSPLLQSVPPVEEGRSSACEKLAMVVLTVLLVGLGFYPVPLIRVIQSAVESLL
jgi:NADH-quinone oxidoreductase subunit N